MNYLLGILLALSSLFLILLVLIQQGRGGGLAGAFGGMGGQSAFGTKAGDLFTRITIGVAAVWILLCVLTVKHAGSHESPFGPGLGSNAESSVVPGGATGEGSPETNPPASPPLRDDGNGGGSNTPAEKSGAE
jgi:preprotein translocase subunit SecG